MQSLGGQRGGGSWNPSQEHGAKRGGNRQVAGRGITDQAQSGKTNHSQVKGWAKTESSQRDRRDKAIRAKVANRGKKVGRRGQD